MACKCVEVLKTKLENIKESYEICKRNLKMMTYLKDKHVAWKYDMERVLRKHGMLHLSYEVENGDGKYSEYRIDFLSLTEKGVGKVISVKKDERTLEKHKARQEAWRAFEEEDK